MRHNGIRRMCRIAVMAAVVAVTAAITIPLQFTPVPLSLATFGVLLAGALTGPIDGTVAVVIYLILGILGLPVFAGFRGGIAVLLGPTGGFLLGYPLLSFVTGYLPRLLKGTGLLFSNILAMTAGTILMYAAGCVWFVSFSGVAPAAAVTSCVVPFLPGDIIKVLLASIISKKMTGSIRTENHGGK